MPAPRIKICGVTQAATLHACIAARADYVGFNFCPPSPRFLSLPAARDLGAQANGRITRVGLFVDADPATIAEAVEAAGLDAIQLHGSEAPQTVAALKARHGLPVWKVISVSGAADLAPAARYAQAADLVLLDAKTPKGALAGGLGLKFDWTLLAAWRPSGPWGLAGGLNPANVAEAVRVTGAPLVDTASGVETAPGVKDMDLIAAFCQAARS
ncbi:phosphoribosylanthranilate isomerase [Novosphingobium kunmingense]|uniref:N-(5'-phosphoribosyl)anthranilate isomerase n=1 Tax=Novosphingobium kunmingense TaxID=1211806 RepID=A0A2N0I1D7_9SPHN|nr:phosphoribosylanthranilate isomerase [Novosphingobium kunmingense]PKB24961.1 phosphoribosylanthranilate isomerase [Novosphingobium kunmingense]